MSKDLVVMKVYPKVNNDYLIEFGLDGFKITESKKQAVFFKKDKTKTFTDVQNKMKKFREFVCKFNLPHSFEIEKTVTYTEKKSKLSDMQVHDEIAKEEI